MPLTNDNHTLHGKLGQFGSVPLMFFKDKRVSRKANCLKVYLGIQSFQGTADNAYPSQEAISQRIDLEPSAIAIAAKELEEAGWLKITHRPGWSPIYECLTYLEPVDEFAAIDGRSQNGDSGRFQAPPQLNCTPSIKLGDTPSIKLGDTPSIKLGDTPSIKLGDKRSPSKSSKEKPSSVSEPRRQKVDPKEVRRITDYYQELFIEDYGAKPTWDGKVMKLVHADISRLGDQTLGKLIQLFFEDPGDFVERNGTGKGYPVFHSQIDHLLERRARMSRGCA